MPDQFYSLIDSLQEMDGLDQKDIDSLEESYTNYLKLQGTFDYLDNDDVELKPELLQPSHHAIRQANFNQIQDQRQVSPHTSPYTSPLPPATLQRNQNILTHGRLSPANSPMANLMDSTELNQVLQPLYSNSMNSMNPTMLIKSSNGSIPGNNMVMNSNSNQMNARFNMSPGTSSPLNHYNHSPAPSPQPPPSYSPQPPSSYSPQPQYTNQGSPALQMNHSNELNRGMMQGSPQPPLYQPQQLPPPQVQHQTQQPQPRKLYQHVEDEEEFDWSSII